MAQRIPGAEFVVFERSAHMAFIEERRPFIRAGFGPGEKVADRLDVGPALLD